MTYRISALVVALDNAVQNARDNTFVPPHVAHERIRTMYTWENVARRTEKVSLTLRPLQHFSFVTSQLKFSKQFPHVFLEICALSLIGCCFRGKIQVKQQPIRGIIVISEDLRHQSTLFPGSLFFRIQKRDPGNEVGSSVSGSTSCRLCEVQKSTAQWQGNRNPTETSSTPPNPKLRIKNMFSPFCVGFVYYELWLKITSQKCVLAK